MKGNLKVKLILNCGNTDEMAIIAVIIAIYAIAKFSSKTNFQGFNGTRTHSLGGSAVVPYQLSYEDPYVGGRPMFLSLS